MVGGNALLLNEASLLEALQMYVNAQLPFKVKVKSLKVYGPEGYRQSADPKVQIVEGSSAHDTLVTFDVEEE